MKLKISTTEGPRGETHPGLTCEATIQAMKTETPGGTIGLQLPIDEVQANEALARVLDNAEYWIVEGEGFRRRFFYEKTIGNRMFLTDDGSLG